MRTHPTNAKNSESVWNQLLRSGLIIIEITRFWTVLRMSSIMDSVCMVGERQLWSCNTSWILYGRAWQEGCVHLGFLRSRYIIKYTDILIQFGVNSPNYLTQNNQQVEGSTKVQHLFSRKIELRPAPCHRISTRSGNHVKASPGQVGSWKWSSTDVEEMRKMAQQQRVVGSVCGARDSPRDLLLSFCRVSDAARNRRTPRYISLPRIRSSSPY